MYIIPRAITKNATETDILKNTISKSKWTLKNIFKSSSSTAESRERKTETETKKRDQTENKKLSNRLKPWHINNHVKCKWYKYIN